MSIKNSINLPLDGKRNIQSFKNQVKGRKKRDVGEALEPVYQTGPLDYEELMQTLNDEYSQPAEKRYLGELINVSIKAGKVQRFRQS
jgi:hypothetical protein